MTKASIIIPIWNGYDDLADCFAALSQQTEDSFGIIAVDNGSTDGSVELITNQFSHVRLIQNTKNLGFGVACNIGLRAATDDVLILLNQDTVVEPDWLAEFISFLATHSDVGVVGSKAYFADGTVQHAGGYIDSQGGGRHYGHRETDRPEFDEIRDVDFVTGASLAIRRSVYEQIGGLDEGFHPAYYEDVDWCYRVRVAGWRVVYLPMSRLIHKEESRLNQPTHAGMYLFHRNRLRFVLKHFSNAHLQEDFLSLEQSWLSEQNHGSQQLNAAMHHAYLYQLLNLTDICGWRARLSGENSAIGQVDSDSTLLANLLTELRILVPYPGLADSQVTNSTILSTWSEREGKNTSIAIIPPPHLLDLNVPPAEELKGLQVSHNVQPYEFHSDTPIVGRLVALGRWLWYQVAARWAVESAQRQQNEVNEYLLNVIRCLRADVNHLQDNINRVHTDFSHQFAQYHQNIAYLDHEVARLYGETDRITAELHHLDAKIYNLDEKLSVQMNYQYRLHQITQEYLTECGRELSDIALSQGQK